MPDWADINSLVPSLAWSGRLVLVGGQSRTSYITSDNISQSHTTYELQPSLVFIQLLAFNFTDLDLSLVPLMLTVVLQSTIYGSFFRELYGIIKIGCCIPVILLVSFFILLRNYDFIPQSVVTARWLLWILFTR